MVPVLATTRSLGPLLSEGLASKFSATTETFLSGETFRIFRSPVAVRKMLSESSIQSPGSLLRGDRQILSGSFLFGPGGDPFKGPARREVESPLGIHGWAFSITPTLI